MIARYTRPEMGRIWSDQNKFQTWLDVEIAATETLAEAGLVPQSAAKAMREKGGFERALFSNAIHNLLEFFHSSPCLSRVCTLLWSDPHLKLVPAIGVVRFNKFV